MKVFLSLLRYNREFFWGFILVTFVALFGMLSFFAPTDPTALYTVMPDTAPNSTYWFGTNSRGQDLFWQMTFAVRNSLTFGLIVALLSRVISITVGLAAGYLGGLVDRGFMFINDIFVALPLFPILVLFYFVMRDDLNTVNLAILLACLGWPFDARLIRSIMIGLRHREFTRHAVFSGMSPTRIMLKEHLPYIMPVIFSTFLGNMIWSVGIEVTLAVLGFTNINLPTFGTVLYWAQQHSALVVGVWWWIAIPIAFITVTFIGLFLLAVSLNEYIDPRSRLRRMGGAS